MSASALVDLGPHLLAVAAVELAQHLLGCLEIAGARPQLLAASTIGPSSL